MGSVLDHIATALAGVPGSINDKLIAFFSTLSFDGTTGVFSVDTLATNEAIFGGKPVFDITHPDFGATAASASEGFQAAYDAAVAASGGIIYIPPSIDGFTLTEPFDGGGAQVGIDVMGAGVELSALRYTLTTDDIFDLTDTRFLRFSDLTIAPAAIKTAGSLFKCLQASDLAFRRMRVGASYIGWDIEDADTIDLDDIFLVDYDTAVWKTGVHSHGGSAALNLDRVYMASSVTNDVTAWAFLLEDCDTVKMTRCGAQKFGATAQFGGLKIARGQWLEFLASHFECGKTDAVAVLVEDDAYGVDFLGCHATTSKYGLQTKAGAGTGPRQLSWKGGRIAFNGQHGVLLEAGSNIDIDSSISNNSVTATDTYDGVHVNAEVSDWSVKGRIGTYMIPVAGGGTKHRYGVRVDAGASDRYDIDARITDAATAPVSDLGTGVDKVVQDQEKKGVACGYDAAPTSYNPGANICLFVRRTVQRRKKINRITINVTLQGGNVDVAIYRDDNGAIGTKVVGSGSVACPAVPRAPIAVAETMLGPGDYWLAFVTDSAIMSLAANLEGGNLTGAKRLVATYPLPAGPVTPTSDVEPAIGIVAERV